MKHWKVRSEETVLKVPSRLEVKKEMVELADGRVVGDYYRVILSSFVQILAEVEGDSIVCMKQYRHGPRRVVLTLPGGGVEPGEDELTAAQRELREETGYSADEWGKVGDFCTLGNQQGSHCTVFRARSMHKVAEPDSGDLEEAEIRFLSRRDLMAAVANGSFGVSSDLAAIGIALCTESDHETS